MQHTSRALALSLALSLVPTLVHAQFGSLGRAAAAAAAARNAKNTATGTTPAPEFDNVTLEITPQHLDQLLKGLAAEQPVLAQIKKDRAAEQSAQVATDKYDECLELHRNQANEHQQANMDKNSTEIQQRIITMMQAQDYAGIKALQDSLMTAAMSTQTAPDSACAPRPDSAFAVKARLENGGRNVDLIGAQAAGMTSQQFGKMQERVMGYLNAGTSAGSGFGFTNGERAAMDARKAEIQKAMQPFMAPQSGR